MSNYIERIKLLTELFDEGHISEQEFGELVDSLRGGAVNEAYDVENDKLTLGGGFELEGFDEYHECKRTDIPETEPDMPLTDMYEQDPAFTSEDKEFDGAFRDYLDSKGEWERVIKTVKGKQVPVWIPINKISDEEKSRYEDFINNTNKAKPGDVIPMDENILRRYINWKGGPEAYHRINGLVKEDVHNTFYHEIEAGEVRKSVDGWNRATGLYKEDVHSGNTLIKPTIYQ